MKVSHWLYLYLLAVLLVCSFGTFVDLSQNKKERHDILPKFDIVLVGTNDIHGTAYPVVLSRKDTGEKYNYGGLVYMARIIQIIKEENKGNVLYLDAGDQYQGGIQASKIISSGEIISDYFNHVNPQAGAIGNHEFDFGPQFLDNYLSQLNHDILSANLIDQKTQEPPLRNQQRSKLYKFPIKQKSPFISQNLTEIKIGVIGLSTIFTPYTTSGFVDGLFPESYKFEQYKQEVIKQATKLQEQGAHAIVIVSHAGNACNNNSDYGIWTIRNQERNIPCEETDEIFRLIDELPEGLVDAVVQGHRHTQSHYFYKGIPIIGTINGGFYLNTIRLRFTLDKDRAYLLDEDLLIQGPIPVCQRVFKGTNKCEYVKPQNLEKAGELLEWSFHGKKVYADPQLSAIYQQKYAEKMKIYEYEIAKNYVSTPMMKDYLSNSAIGNLITNVMAKSIQSRGDLKFDFLILNGGGFRSTWYPGVIRYAELHSMLPFDNEVYSFKISGRDLKSMLEIVQNGVKRYYPTWGLQQKFLLNPSKQFQLQKIRDKHLQREISLRKSQQYFSLQSLTSALTKQPISDDKIYTGVSIGFLLNGGDDFSHFVKNPDQIIFKDKTLYPMMMKDLIQAGLEELEQVDDDSLVGPNHMERIVFEGMGDLQQ